MTSVNIMWLWLSLLEIWSQIIFIHLFPLNIKGILKNANQKVSATVQTGSKIFLWCELQNVKFEVGT